MALHASPPRPSKRPRLSHTASPLDLAAESLAAEEELARQRLLSQSKLKSSWEGIFAKYTQDFEGIADEIDQATGKIIVDNGHVRSLSDSLVIEDEKAWAWEEIVELEEGDGKEVGTKGGERRLAIKSTDQGDGRWEDTPTVGGGCDVCRYKDELDDSICLACSLKPSSPSTGPPIHPIKFADSATSISAIAGSSQQNPPRTSPTSDRDVSMGGTMDGTSDTAPASEIVPSDAFILEKLGSHGATVAGLLAKARPQNVDTPPSVPISTHAEATPGKSATSPIHGDRVSADPSPRQSQFQPLAVEIPPSKQNRQGQTDIRTWVPKKVITWLFTHGLLSDEDDMDIAPALKEHNISGAVVVSSLTFNDLKDKLRIESFSKRMQLWSGVLKLRALVSSKSLPPAQPIASPKDATDIVRESDPWAPPPQEEDPFYSHIWRDEHPDGTPVRFPPRVVDPIPPVSGALPGGSPTMNENGKKKRKRDSPKAVGVVKTPATNTPTVKGVSARTPAAKTPTVKGVSAKTKNRITKTLAAKSVSAKTSAAKTPTVKTPTVKTPTTKTPTAKTPTVKTPAEMTPTLKGMSPKVLAGRTPAVKSVPAKPPTTKTPTIKSMPVKTPAATPKTKTPAVKNLGAKSAPAKTPAKKTPAASIAKTPAIPKTPATAKSASKAVIPGWTTGSIGPAKKGAAGKSFLALGDAEDKDDELSVSYTKDNPVPIRTIKAITPKVTAQKEGDNKVGGAAQEGEAEGVDAKERGKTHEEHKCSGGFCFACLNLEGEEDDLI